MESSGLFFPFFFPKQFKVGREVGKEVGREIALFRIYAALLSVKKVESGTVLAH